MLRKNAPSAVTRETAEGRLGWQTFGIRRRIRFALRYFFLTRHRRPVKRISFAPFNFVASLSPRRVPGTGMTRKRGGRGGERR